MKIVVRKSLRLDLPVVLDFVAVCPGVASAILLPEMQRRFGCKRRAAQDALAILIRGGWLERHDDDTDARRKRYYVTAKGEDDLQTWDGERAIRLARWRYSTISTRARQRHQSATSRWV
jgi:DNA-binding MarR family transcriptional regulator